MYRSKTDPNKFLFSKRNMSYFLTKSSCSTGGEGGTLESKCELKNKIKSVTKNAK